MLLRKKLYFVYTQIIFCLRTNYNSLSQKMKEMSKNQAISNQIFTCSNVRHYVSIYFNFLLNKWAQKNDFRNQHCLHYFETYKSFSWQMVLVEHTETHFRKELYQNIAMLKYYTYRIEYRLCLIVTFYWTCNVSFQIHRSKIVIQKIVMIPLVVHCCIREKWWGSDYPPLNKSLFWEKSKEQTYFLLVLIIFYTLLSASFWDEILHYALCLSK